MILEDLLSKLTELRAISNELEPDVIERHSFHGKMIQFAEKFLESLKQKKCYSNEVVKFGMLSISDEKKNFEDLLEIYTSEVVNKGIKTASGGYMGYIPGGGIFMSAIADYIASVTNPYAGIYFASPGAVTIENEVINWLKKVFSFPKNAIGNLTSGGSIATLIALTAARDHHGIKGEVIAKSVIYLTSHVHYCFYKALKIIGLEDVQIREIKCDGRHRLDVEELEAHIQKDKFIGLNPFLVAATAGTTNTGSIDPLEKIAFIAKQQDLWLHVDAAYGGFFILTESRKNCFKGIEEADSLVVDPHKGLFLPYGIGAVLIKQKAAILHSNHYTANYLQDAYNEESDLSPADVSPELTKHFRGLRIWLPLQLYGTSPFAAALEEKLLLTHYFRDKLKELGFKVGPEPDLSVSYFWYPSTTVDENVFNKKLMDLIHQDGRSFLSSTTIDNQFVIRIALLSFRTNLEKVDQAISMIKEALDKINDKEVIEI